MHKKSIKKLQQYLQTRKISSEELIKYFLNRIKKINNKINGLITINYDIAIKQAKKIDLSKNIYSVNPLSGIPFILKDNFCTAGIKTTAGSQTLKAFVPTYNSTVYAKLMNENMILIGKSNMDEFAIGGNTESSFFGPTCNPWNLNKTAGGSSGGSAASVISGFSPAAIGTDSGGSIRQPASFCGITGIKPTYGRISRFGIISFTSSLDQAGPMGISAEDCAILLEIITGMDKKDPMSINKTVPKYTKTLNNKIKNLIIGIPKEFLNISLNRKITNIMNNVIKTFLSIGVKIKYISLPNTFLSIPTYYITSSSEASSNLARYDSIRFGYKYKIPKNIEELYKCSRTMGFDSEIKKRILLGTLILSSKHHNTFYLQAQKIRRIIQHDFKEAFKKINIIITPTTPSSAFNLSQKSNNSIKIYLEDLFTCNVNLTGIPALSMPAGFINKMPVGIQLIGDYFKEFMILNIAHQYQLNSDWHLQKPIN